MNIVLDLGGLGPADLAAGSSALPELMASLNVLAEPEHLPEAADWAARATSADPELHDEVLFFAPLWARFRCRSSPAPCRSRRAWTRNWPRSRHCRAMNSWRWWPPGVLGTMALPDPPAHEIRAGTTAA
ncbi:DUF5937 family protein [Streptomyces sp. NPDC007907]|uniref:DUF5937 family protein n=1 Tax=Streptomyces sp. NPDC007907 TaxID=3364789 RepID=UPI0036EC40D5